MLLFEHDCIKNLVKELELFKVTNNKRIAELEEKLLKCTRENHKIVRQSSAALASCGYVYDESRESELVKMEAKRDLEQQAKGVEDAVEFFSPARDLDVEALQDYAENLRKKAEDL